MSNRFPSKTIPQSACRLTAPFTQGSLPSIQHHKKLPAQFPRRVCTGSCYFAEYFSAKDITLSHRDLFHFMLFVRESKGRKKTVRWTVFSPWEIPMPRSGIKKLIKVNGKGTPSVCLPLLLKSAQQFQNDAAVFSLLCGQSGKDRAIFRVSTAGFILGKTAHLLSVAAAQTSIG